MPAQKKPLTRSKKKMIIVSCLAGLVLVVGAAWWFVSHRSSEADKISVITIVGADGKKTFSIAPETAAEQSALPTASTDPQTELALEQQFQDPSATDEYCSQEEQACFSYPRSWAAEDKRDVHHEHFVLTSPNGTEVLWYTNSPESFDCVPGEANALLFTLKGELPDYKQFLAYVGTEKFIYKRIGLVRIEEVLRDSSVPTLGDVGTCINNYGPRFVSETTGFTTNTFSTTGTDVINTDDLPVLQQIFTSFHYKSGNYYKEPVN